MEYKNNFTRYVVALVLVESCVLISTWLLITGGQVHSLFMESWHFWLGYFLYYFQKHLTRNCQKRLKMESHLEKGRNGALVYPETTLLTQYLSSNTFKTWNIIFSVTLDVTSFLNSMRDVSVCSILYFTAFNK